MEEERRKSIRIKKSLTVQYSRNLNQGAATWDMTTIKDISETGMCIVTDKDFLPNEIINFRLKIPFRPFEWLEFSGKIISSEVFKTKACVTRVEFVDLKEEQKGLIKEYIKWFLDKQGGEK